MAGTPEPVLSFAIIVGHRVATSRHQSFEELASVVEAACSAADVSRSCGVLCLGLVTGVGEFTTAAAISRKGELWTTVGRELSTTAFWPALGELKRESLNGGSGDARLSTRQDGSGDEVSLLSSAS